MDVTIEKLIYGGEGLAHHEGATVFVPFVLPASGVAVEAGGTEKEIRARACGADFGGFAGTDRGAVPAFRRLRRLRLSAHPLRRAAAVQKRNFARDFAAAWARLNGPARSRRILRLRGVIATARNGRFVRWRARNRTMRAGDGGAAARTSLASDIFARIRRRFVRWRIVRSFRRCC